MFIGLHGCGESKTVCDCEMGGFVIVHAPKGEVTEIALTGAACRDAKANCTDDRRGGDRFIAGCEQYTIAGTAAGECSVHVRTKTNGTREEVRTIEDHRDQGCCGGFEVAPSSAWEIPIGDAGVSPVTDGG
ncbi:hypothetical protein AKJ09_08186 [Labilithrix luteola]|uniref:Uncharacterized protein n=1 Tax=Labilithrix luteola TaxID=1391654 RepID=A0A0K1Q714_9BACT|nr:hypothetical protein AKJ09_08186 [Labilithrix luteola]